MGAKRAGEQHLRVLSQNNSGTYQITLPIETIRALRWQRGQRIVVKKLGDRLILENRKK